MRMSERLRQIIVGLLGLSLFGGLTTVGVQYAFGYYDDTYRVTGLFTAAGQGLQIDSDVQMRGIDIGKVAGVELVDGRALVKMDIDAGQKIPADATAVVRPKTLFGEKFVDVVADDPKAEEDGPFLAAGDEFTETLGGFELERVLSDAYPILEAIDPAELSVVLGELADGGRDLGPTINKSIVDGSKVLDVWADHDADTRQALTDLALISEELDKRAGDLVAGARSLHSALPTLLEREDELTTLLEQTSRLSADVADVLESNRHFLRAGAVDGSRGLQALYEERGRIRPLVVGLRQYVQTIAESISIPLGDGTKMARVRGILGGEPCGEGQGESCFVPGGPNGPQPPVPIPTLPGVPLPPLPVPVEGTDGIGGLLQEAFGR